MSGRGPVRRFSRLLKPAVVILAGLIVSLPGGRLGATVLELTDLDVLLTGPEPGQMFRPGSADFDGDGNDDLVIVYSTSLFNSMIALVPGGALPRNGPMVPKTRVLGGGLPLGNSSPFADINDDGRADLFLVTGSSVPPLIKGFFGKTDLPAEIDVAVSPGDLILNSTYTAMVAGMASGDFNGDGTEDMAILQTGGIPSESRVRLLLGQPGFPPSTVNLDLPGSAIAFNKPTPPIHSLAVGDVNGDGKSDLILSITLADPLGRQGAGEILVIWGRDNFPGTWDLQTTPADLTLQGGNVFGNLYCADAGDTNGDGKDDLVLFDKAGDPNVFIMDGAILAGAPATIDLAIGIPGYSPPSIPGLTVGGQATARLEDFDGDGLADVAHQGPIIPLSLFLSSDFYGASSFPPPALQFFGSRYMNMGDFNGDGRMDLATSPDGLFTGSAGVIYGHRPLDNPSLTWNGWAPAAPRALLGLSVEGHPTEMRLSGDLADSFRDQWIPFQPSLPVTLTAPAGTKTLTALFRNAFGRQSPLASLSIPFDPGASGVETVTNLVEAPGQSAVVHCTLDKPARVTAAVFDQTGALLVQLLDGDLGPGVWPLAWDGANAAGRSVPPGVYFLSVKIDGQINRRKILVR